MQLLTKEKQIANSVISASRKHFCGCANTHVHEFFEIEYVISGSGSCLIDGCTYDMEAGTLFLLTPANTHTVRDADAELINVMFRCDHALPSLALPTLYAPISPRFSLAATDRPLVLALLSELVAMHSDNLEYAQTLLSCLLQKLSFYPQKDETAPLPYIQRAYLYMTEHFKNGITLESTAAHLGLSSTYLSELFAQQTGISFKTYLDRIRFSHARNLLAFTDMPICAIPAHCGFGDYANFSRRFKSLLGMTPGDYRQKHKIARKQ